jgi:hypothetical protein
MKKSLKILSLILALILSFSVFAACDSGSSSTDETKAETPTGDKENGSEAGTTADGSGAENASDETDSEEQIETAPMPEIDKKNYGADYFMHIQQDVNAMNYHWLEESDNDPMSQALFARQEKVREHLGVTITASEAGANTTYTEAFKNAIKNKDDSIQLMLSHVHSGIESLVTGGYLQDFKNVEQLNLDADYWKYDFMEGIALNDHMFLGNSNFNILYTHVIAFNKSMLEQYGDALNESVYDMVFNKRWTLDQMISLASLVSIDQTANGKTEDDTFGITGIQWIAFVGFLNASDIQLIDVDESGQYALSFYNELNQAKTTALIEKLSAMVASDYAWFRYRVESTPEVQLYTGRSLMELKGTKALSSYCDYDIDFGILPYPMYDEAQAEVGYRHLQWGGYQCIPAYLADPVMAGETLEMLSYYSYDVNVTYYEKLLGKQVADAPLDRQMLDIVWDTICSDFGQTYHEASGGVLYMVPELTWVNTTQNIASYYKSKEKSSSKLIKKFLINVK